MSALFWCLRCVTEGFVSQVAQYNFILVVGDKEASDGTVAIRFRDETTAKSVKDVAGLDAGSEHGTVSVGVDELLSVCAKLRAAFK